MGDEVTTVTRRDVWVHMLLYPRHTLPTAAAPMFVAMGLAAHNGVLRPWIAFLAFVAGWLIQLGGVITDNYYNLRRHEDDEEHADFVQALREGTVTLGELRAAILACFAGAAAAGTYLVAIGGIPVIVIGLASAMASLLYSAGPFPLGDNGLGDPLFFLFFGIVSVAGIYYVQAGSITGQVVMAALPIAALTTNILLIDNLRDLEYDRKKREHTLAVLIGPKWTRIEYLAFLLLAYAVPVAMAIRASRPLLLLPLLSIPYAAIVAARVMKGRTYRELLPMTPKAGQVLLSHSVLFAIGLAA